MLGIGACRRARWQYENSRPLDAERRDSQLWSPSVDALWRFPAVEGHDARPAGAHLGEESGHVQRVREIRLDCDADAVLLSVEQVGGIACHTGRERCFYRRLLAGEWVETDPVLKDPGEIYRHRPDQGASHD